MTCMVRVLAVDGNSLVHRAYHSQARTGHQTWAVRGLLSQLVTAAERVCPAAILLRELGSARAAFDDVAGGGERVVAAIGRGGARRLAAPGAREAWELNCQVMAMRDDVPLRLDLGGGPGCLPLDPAAVRATFLAQQLTWTVSAALRALCDQEPRDAQWPDEPVAWTARPRFARLAPKAEQPALF